MPIKKIIISENMLKKIEDSKEPIFVVGIPASTSPERSGDYVLQEVQQKYTGITLAGTTCDTINFVAVEGEKEKMRLKSVKLTIGIVPSLEFGWEKE